MKNIAINKPHYNEINNIRGKFPKQRISKFQTSLLNKVSQNDGSSKSLSSSQSNFHDLKFIFLLLNSSHNLHKVGCDQYFARKDQASCSIIVSYSQIKTSFRNLNLTPFRQSAERYRPFYEKPGNYRQTCVKDHL